MSLAKGHQDRLCCCGWDLYVHRELLGSGCCHQHLHPGVKYLLREGSAAGRAVLTRPAVPSQLRAGLMWHTLCMPMVWCTICLVWVSRFLELRILLLFLYSVLSCPCCGCRYLSAGLQIWVRSTSQCTIPCAMSSNVFRFTIRSAILAALATLLRESPCWREKKGRENVFPVCLQVPQISCDWKTWVLWFWIQINLKCVIPAPNDMGTWKNVIALL